MPKLEGKRMFLFLAPKKVAQKKQEQPEEEKAAPVKEKKAPQQKAPKEYKGPWVEGDEF